MSIMKSVKDTLIGAGKEGLKVGSKLTQVARLNLSLKIEQDKQRSLFQDIGLIVHYEDATSVESNHKIREIRDKIIEHQIEIDRIKIEIENLNKTNICTYCGYQTDQEQNFCPNCSKPRK